MVFVFLVLWQTVLFSVVAALIYTPTSRVLISLFFTSSPAPASSCLFGTSHSNRREALSHPGLGLHLPEDQWCGASLPVSVGHLLREMSVRSFACCLTLSHSHFWASFDPLWPRENRIFSDELLLEFKMIYMRDLHTSPWSNEWFSISWLRVVGLDTEPTYPKNQTC